jgi:NAD(P)-dependent dehydrogenase (short-subunit alcohol dehydrogenase family)
MVRAGGEEGALEGVTDYRDFYRERPVLVTGGLGFIGSNLCRRLADLGARVTAVDSVDILARVAGYLMKVNFEDGQHVKAGDVLFEIDARPYEAGVMQAEGELARWRAAGVACAHDARTAPQRDTQDERRQEHRRMEHVPHHRARQRGDAGPQRTERDPEVVTARPAG